MGLIVQTSREAGIDTTFPQSLHDCYARDVARGHGIHDLPALYDILPEEQSEIAHEPEANDRHGALLCRHANGPAITGAPSHGGRLAAAGSAW